jgi:hypothetical protein
LGVKNQPPRLDDVENVVRHLSRTVGLTGGNPDYAHPNMCLINVGVYTGNRVSYSYAGPRGEPCTDTPAPVSCNISGPSTLTHPNQLANNIVSTVGDRWRVRCTGRALVSVSTSTDVELINQTDHIASGLYVDRPGETSSTVYVEPTADVYIVSKLETNSAPPGQYTGSGIITISWY